MINFKNFFEYSYDDLIDEFIYLTKQHWYSQLWEYSKWLGDNLKIYHETDADKKWDVVKNDVDKTFWHKLVSKFDIPTDQGRIPAGKPIEIYIKNGYYFLSYETKSLPCDPICWRSHIDLTPRYEKFVNHRMLPVNEFVKKEQELKKVGLKVHPFKIIGNEDFVKNIKTDPIKKKYFSEFARYLLNFDEDFSIKQLYDKCVAKDRFDRKFVFNNLNKQIKEYLHHLDEII